MNSGKNDDGETDLYNRFNIDEDDLKILKIFQKNPNTTHVDIANRINKSQPAVGARVTKLERKHVLSTQKGVNFKEVKEKLYLLMVDVQTRDPNPIMKEALSCPFIINAFKRSGTRNLVVLLTSTKMEKLEMIIDKHFRSNPLVASVETAFIVDIAKDFILPVSWDFLKLEDIPCGETCCQDVKQRKGKLEI
ncbi:MAG: Lrp/AsnC family transcriptional regulator [Candidatus Hodarchaeota archaeon]